MIPENDFQVEDKYIIGAANGYRRAIIIEEEEPEEEEPETPALTEIPEATETTLGGIKIAYDETTFTLYINTSSDIVVESSVSEE